MPSDAEILSMGLSPDQIVTVLYLRTRHLGGEIHARTADVAAVLGCGYRKAASVIASLINTNVIVRVVRGIYRFADDLQQRAEEVHTGALQVFVYKPQANSHAVEPASQALTGDSPPLGGMKGNVIQMRDYDDGDDDLGGVGLTEERTTPAQRRRAEREERKRAPKPYTELPPSQWTMDHVVGEFRKRFRAISPRTIQNWRDGRIHNMTGGNRLGMALRKWSADADVTPEEAMTALDWFFADEAEMSRFTNDFPAYTLYLAYLGRSLSRLRADAPDEAFEEYARNQALPW